MEKEQSYRAPGHTRRVALVMPTTRPWSCPPRAPGHAHRVALVTPTAWPCHARRALPVIPAVSKRESR